MKKDHFKYLELSFLLTFFFILKKLQAKSREQLKKMYVIFIDIKQAYDKIDIVRLTRKHSRYSEKFDLTSNWKITIIRCAIYNIMYLPLKRVLKGGNLKRYDLLYHKRPRFVSISIGKSKLKEVENRFRW